MFTANLNVFGWTPAYYDSILLTIASYQIYNDLWKPIMRQSSDNRDEHSCVRKNLFGSVLLKLNEHFIDNKWKWKLMGFANVPSSFSGQSVTDVLFVTKVKRRYNNNIHTLRTRIRCGQDRRHSNDYSI